MNKKEMDRVFDMFLAEFPPVYEEPNQCPHMYCLDEGVYICARCHRIERGYVDPFVEYKDRPLSPSSPYDKMTHFKEKLDELCDRVLIPDEVMDVCKDLTNQEDIRVRLHQHRLKKYYPCVYQIMRQKGIAIPTLLQQEKERLCRLFKQVEHAYIKVRKKTNMINYSFLLSKLCPMIGRSDLVPYLFILHSKRKVREYNLLWEKILLLL
jgi:hypothetical protein